MGSRRGNKSLFPHSHFLLWGLVQLPCWQMKRSSWQRCVSEETHSLSVCSSPQANTKVNSDKWRSIRWDMLYKSGLKGVRNIKKLSRNLIFVHGKSPHSIFIHHGLQWCNLYVLYEKGMALLLCTQSGIYVYHMFACYICFFFFFMQGDLERESILSMALLCLNKGLKNVHKYFSVYLLPCFTRFMWYNLYS